MAVTRLSIGEIKMYRIASKPFGVLLSTALTLFGTHASAATFLGFNSGPFYSIVGTVDAPTEPAPLKVIFDEAVALDTSISILNSDPSIAIAGGGGQVTVLAGQSSATVLLDAFSIGTVTLTGTLGEIVATTSVNVVSNTPSVPIPNAAWLFTTGLGALGIFKRRSTC